MNGPWNDPRVETGLARQFETWRTCLDDGATRIGWKVGFGAPASLELMQVEAPLMGHLTDATLLPSDAGVNVKGWQNGVVEFEVAVYLASDLGSGATASEARAAVGAVGPAIELADIDLPVEPGNVGNIVAGNIFHRAVLLGTADPNRSGIDTSGLTARILVDGREWATTESLEDLTGSYPSIVSTVADTLAANDQVLREGDVVITGSVIPPISVREGSAFTFILEPFEALNVRLDR